LVAPDRHCQQGLQEGYTIADDVPFSRVLDHASGKMRPYRERGKEKKTVCHWGQRKLMVSEMEFITKFYDKAKIVVYAGAAPGTHIPCLAQLFPKLRFVLVDPRPFSSDVVKLAKSTALTGSSGPGIELHVGFFSDDMAREYAREEGVLFISDVRTSDGRGEGATMPPQDVVFPTQQSVEGDMELQQRWHGLMRPVASSLKFRLPWDDGGTTSYLRGDISLPVWGGVSTTECRLFVEGCVRGADEDGACAGSELVVYDNKMYEQQMFYFQTHSRIARYKNDFVEFYKCSCFDCTSEAAVLSSFLATVCGKATVLLSEVSELSKRLDHACHRDHRNPRTLFDANLDPTERKTRILKRQRRA